MLTATSVSAVQHQWPTMAQKCAIEKRCVEFIWSDASDRLETFVAYLRALSSVESTWIQQLATHGPERAMSRLRQAISLAFPSS